MCYGCEGEKSKKMSGNILQPAIIIHVSIFGAVFIFEAVFILEVIFIFARCCFGGRLATMLVDRYFHNHNFFLLQFSNFFLRYNLFSEKECSDQKPYLAKVVQSAQ